MSNSTKREVKVFEIDGDKVWQTNMSCQLADKGVSVETLTLRKESHESVAGKPCIHLNVLNGTQGANASFSGQQAYVTLNEHTAKALRDWLIRLYPLELTDLALLKSKMENTQ